MKDIKTEDRGQTPFTLCIAGFRGHRVHTGCVNSQIVEKTLQDKAWEVSNEDAYIRYVTDIWNFSQRSKS